MMRAMPGSAPLLLLSMPQMADPNFSRAVVLLCDYTADGAFGLVVNRQMTEPAWTLIKTEPAIAVHKDLRLWLGGPVDPQRGFLLHTPDWGGRDSIDVAGRWMLSATLDILKAIAEGRGPSRWVAALGYAGWGPDQLDDEMRRHGWFATAGTDALLYDRDVDTRWTAAFQDAGIDSRLLAAHSGTA
jgi:putative transcriptional regulator